MCGINGIYGLLSRQDERSRALGLMNESIKHRGPDDEGIIDFNEIALGHRRLSIIDLTKQGHQPMVSEDKRYSIVFNGEIYNYQSIKKDLADYKFKSNTDTEVVLASYIKFGKECLEQFNGMFAFAIWDNHKKSLFIARDRLGIKPLYYYNDDQKFVFSSELRALLKSELVPKKINRRGLLDYFQYQTVHAPQTIVEGVTMLMPGNYVEIGEGLDVNIKSYWSLRENTSVINEKYVDVKSSIKKLLFEAVEKRMISDVP